MEHSETEQSGPEYYTAGWSQVEHIYVVYAAIDGIGGGV